jgi:hypothetical protein
VSRRALLKGGTYEQVARRLDLRRHRPGKAFHAAVKKTGRKRLIFGALYTEICLAYPVIEAMKERYEATFVVDGVE